MDEEQQKPMQYPAKPNANPANLNAGTGAGSAGTECANTRFNSTKAQITSMSSDDLDTEIDAYSGRVFGTGCRPP
jgi:hypothetical protein